MVRRKWQCVHGDMCPIAPEFKVELTLIFACGAWNSIFVRGGAFLAALFSKTVWRIPISVRSHQSPCLLR